MKRENNEGRKNGLRFSSLTSLQICCIWKKGKCNWSQNLGHSCISLLFLLLPIWENCFRCTAIWNHLPSFVFIIFVSSHGKSIRGTAAYIWILRRRLPNQFRSCCFSRLVFKFAFVRSTCLGNLTTQEQYWNLIDLASSPPAMTLAFLLTRGLGGWGDQCGTKHQVWTQLLSHLV